MEANLTDAVLGGADLTGAYLWRANLRGAFFGGANLLRAKLTGADLTGVDLSNVDNLVQEQLEEAEGDENTSLPSYLKPPAHWDVKTVEQVEGD